MASRPRSAADCREYPEGKDVLRSLGEGGLASHPRSFPMFYTYILRSLSNPEQRYIGSTSDLRSRLAKHNKGDVPHTAKFHPWKVEAYFAFETQEKPPLSNNISNPAADTPLPSVISEFRIRVLQ